jgi:hypothetical protein
MRTSGFTKVLLVGMLILPLPGAAGGGQGGSDLVGHMTRMQYFVHKLGLAITAGNEGLQGYYVHEVEGVIEAVSKVDEYEGIPVGQLVRDTLYPTFELLERTLSAGDPEAADAAFDRLVEACNACHDASGHGFIRIKRRTDNPFMQDFAPAE